MKHAKPYKDPDLSLNGLATMLHMPCNQLSQIINALEGKTFYHYINTYRISEFLEIASLPENKKLSYLGLANDCGFSSKSTFNKYFKLRTGKALSEYFPA
ncbi:helix-turn-helix domain-containing protein [Chryseolinea sp. T2]|uniref:helix-turn-helix domain-containing protein n=1 Tax=Chryseolinea sp. T2 TaxID=3129255 RepID=UPI0030774061